MQHASEQLQIEVDQILLEHQAQVLRDGKKSKKKVIFIHFEKNNDVIEMMYTLTSYTIVLENA